MSKRNSWTWWFEVLHCERARAWSRRASKAMARPTVLVALILVMVPVCVVLLHPAKPTASGTTWYVNSSTGNDSYDCLFPTGTGPCATIGGAIGKASAGDTIDVAAGTYDEQVAVTKTPH